MKTYNLLINPFAELELEEAKDWYNLQQDDLGERFVKEIEKTIIRITENPFQFPKEIKQIRKAIVNDFPYSIFFYVADNLINVFAIFHSSRNPMIWKKRFRERKK
jgi:toxin ParE1/3/4